jgi:hypothetical protein
MEIASITLVDLDSLSTEDAIMKAIMKAITNVNCKIVFPFPGNFADIRFHEFEREKKKCIIYRVRSELRDLYTTVIRTFQTRGGDPQRNVINYFSSAGAGKSYNLAALTVIFHKLKSINKFAKDVIYFSSCSNAFKVDSFIVRKFIDPMQRAFPGEAERIGHFKTKQEIISFINEKPNFSIIFILDGYQFFEGPGGAVARSFLDDIATLQCELRCSSPNSDVPFVMQFSDTSGRQAIHFTLSPFLTDSEFASWISDIPKFKSLSESQLDLVSDFTGRNPLYLMQFLEKLEEGGTFDDLANRFFITMVDTHSKKIAKKAAEHLTNEDREMFVYYMSSAINEQPISGISELYYDHRYFTKVVLADNITKLVPVNGIIKKIITDMLTRDERYRQAFEANVMQLQWIGYAKKSRNPVVMGFCFELYSILQIQTFPAKNIPGLPATIQHFFTSKSSGAPLAPGTPCEEGAYLYRFQSYRYKYVDGVIVHVKHVSKGKIVVDIYGLQVTFLTAPEHAHSLKFFSKNGDYKQFVPVLTAGEVTINKCLYWIRPTFRKPKGKEKDPPANSQIEWMIEENVTQHFRYIDIGDEAPVVEAIF